MNPYNIIPNVILACAALCITGACSDVFEKDISGEEVKLLAPADGKEVNSGTIEFWWDEVQDATAYEIHIVKGSFAAPEALEADSAVSDNIFRLYLTAGAYEWKVVARNESSETESGIFQLTVDSSFSLADEKVVLIYPTQSQCTSDTEVLFRWVNLNIPGIHYVIDVRLGAFDDGLNLYSYETTLNQQSIAINSDFEGSLSWGVRAVNDEGASPYSSYAFSLDRTTPDKVILTAPVGGDSVSGLDINFTWTGQEGSGCDEYDSLIIYSDSLAENSVLREQLEAGVNHFSTDLDAGNYWWEVFRYDRAGNVSPASTRETFYAKPE